MKKSKTIRIIIYPLLAIATLCAVFAPFKDQEPRLAYFLVALFFLILDAWVDKMRKYNILRVQFRRQKCILEEVFKYTPYMIYLKDLSSRYISCNSAYTKFFSFSSSSKIEGRPDFEFMRADMARFARDTDIQVLNNCETTYYDHSAINGRFEEKIIETIKSPLIIDGAVKGIIGISKDVTEIRELYAKLSEKEFQLKELLDNIPVACYMEDSHENFLIGNNKLEKLIGFPLQTPLGKAAYEKFISSWSNDLCEKVQKDNKPYTVDKEVDTAIGKRWLEVTKAPILDASGNLSKIAVVIRDVSSAKEIEAQKETFIATLTHDLKTPTIAQIKALEILSSGTLGPLNEGQKEFLEQISNSCQYMYSMISTLLSAYKYESGQIKLVKEEFDLVKIVKECKGELEPLAEERKQKFKLYLPKNEVIIDADRIEIKRVITNILSNAILYSYEDSPLEIHVEDKNGVTKFYAINNGKIMSEEKVVKIFQKYNSSNQKFRKISTGLGLYLTKRIVLAHGAIMIAKSEEGIGNTFGFEMGPMQSQNNVELICREAVSA